MESALSRSQTHFFGEGRYGFDGHKLGFSPDNGAICLHYDGVFFAKFHNGLLLAERVQLDLVDGRHEVFQLAFEFLVFYLVLEVLFQLLEVFHPAGLIFRVYVMDSRDSGLLV